MYRKYEEDDKWGKRLFIASLILLGGLAYYTLIYNNDSNKDNKNPSALEQKVDTLTSDSTMNNVKESE